MATPAIPFHRYSEVTTFSGGGGVVLINAGQFAPANFVLEGIDLVNDPVTEGLTASVVLTQSGPAGNQGAIFQAFVYAQSQGWFPWRGEMVIFSNFSLSASASGGEWSFVAWGHVEPAYSISP